MRFRFFAISLHFLYGSFSLKLLLPISFSTFACWPAVIPRTAAHDLWPKICKKIICDYLQSLVWELKQGNLKGYGQKNYFWQNGPVSLSTFLSFKSLSFTDLFLFREKELLSIGWHSAPTAFKLSWNSLRHWSLT